MTRYSFDANVFLDMDRLKNPLYPPDVFPSLWRNLGELVQAGKIFVCREAFDEVASQGQTDRVAVQLRKWRDEFPEFVPETAYDEAVVAAARRISRDFPNLIKEKKGKSGTVIADPFIIAHARATGAAVITNEKSEGLYPVNFGQIPDVCKSLKPEIGCMNLVEFMRNEKMEF